MNVLNEPKYKSRPHLCALVVNSKWKVNCRNTVSFLFGVIQEQEELEMGPEGLT